MALNANGRLQESVEALTLRAKQRMRIRCAHCIDFVFEGDAGDCWAQAEQHLRAQHPGMKRKRPQRAKRAWFEKQAELRRAQIADREKDGQ